MAWRNLVDILRLVVRRTKPLIGLLALAGSGCDPSVFDVRVSRDEDAGARRNTIPAEPAAGDSGSPGAVDHSSLPSKVAAGAGGSAATAGKGGAAAGSGGHAGSSDAGAGSDGAGAGSGGVIAGSGGAGAAGVGGAADMPPTTPPACTHPSDLTQLKLSTSDVGIVPIPAWVDQRTVAATATVRDRVLVLFTVPNEFGMAGWADVQSLMSFPLHLEEQGPFVPLFEASAVAAGRGLAVGSAVSDGDGALVYFADAQGLSVVASGIARLPFNGNHAEVLRAAGALFPPPAGVDPAPWRPVFYSGALAVSEGDVDYVYVYGCQGNPKNADEAQGEAHEAPCRLARVLRTDASVGDSYRYWSGQAWVADVTQAALVLDHTTGNLSVSYNAYLGKYLAVHSGFWNAVVLRWADRPEGPWNTLGQFDTVTATAGFGSTFGAIEVLALRDACQRITYVTYASPDSVAQPDGGASTTDYSTHLVRVELQ